MTPQGIPKGQTDKMFHLQPSSLGMVGGENLEHFIKKKKKDPSDVTVSPVKARRAHRKETAEQSFPDQGAQSNVHVDLC